MKLDWIVYIRNRVMMMMMMIFFCFCPIHTQISQYVKICHVLSFDSFFLFYFEKQLHLLYQVTCSSLMFHLPLVFWFLISTCSLMHFICLPLSSPAPQPFVIVQAAEKLKAIIIYWKFSHKFCWDSILKGVFLFLIQNFVVLFSQPPPPISCDIFYMV